MERIDNKRIVGVVTLFHPQEVAKNNISLYIDDVDFLIVWDNSEKNHQDWFILYTNVEYHWDGMNSFIAPALNYAWRWAKNNSYDAVLIMDQDSKWDNFKIFRKEVVAQMNKGIIAAFKPYVVGDDYWTVTSNVVSRRRFINSGTILPVTLLDAIDGADECFALDALDTDMSIRILKENYKILCLTRGRLIHSIGNPRRSKILRLFTNDYGPFRTYTITRSHIICYRKNKQWMNFLEKKIFFKEILIYKFFRIILIESEKYERMKMFFRGIKDGLRYKF